MTYRYQAVRSIANKQFSIQLSISEITEDDLQLIQKYGSPNVDVGSSFTGPPAFTLPEKLVSLQFLQHTEIFDGSSDLSAAQTKALAWYTEVNARISAALTTLRANTDSYTLDRTIEV